MRLPGIEKNWIQRRVHGSDHVVHPARQVNEDVRRRVCLSRLYEVVVYRITLPRADAFGYSDDVTQAGRGFDLCS